MGEGEDVPTETAKKKKITRGRRGDGSRYKDESSGLWVVAIELPPVKWNADGHPIRNRKVQRFKTRTAADAALRELREQKRQMGTLPTSSPTVESWFAKWLTVQVAPNERPRTTKTYEQYVRSYIVPALGGSTKLSKLTPDSIRNIEKYVTGLGLSPSTATNAFHYASAGLEFALREGVLFMNPAKRIDPPRKARPKLDVFTQDDAIKLFKHLDGHPDEALFKTYLLTGARRGEVAGLEFDRIGDYLDLSWQLQRLEYTHGCGDTCGKKRAGNCPSREFYKPADFEYRQVKGGMYLTRPKSNAGWRIIPLVEPLRSTLLQYIANVPENEWGLIFPTVHARYGGLVPPDPDRITREWPKLRDEVFGKGRTVRLHDIRHTTVDLLYLAGVPEDLIQEIIGHSTRSMTRQYKSRSDIVRLRGAMSSLSGMLKQPDGDAIHTLEISA